METALATVDASEYTPTWLERRLYAALDSLGIAYEPQYPVGVYTIDAFLPTHSLAIEADGCSFHACLACGYDTPDDQSKRERDKVRDRRLLLCHGIATIRIWGHDLNHDEQALNSVRAALRAAGVLPPAEGSEPAPDTPEPETSTHEDQADQPERKEHTEHEHHERPYRGHHERQQALARKATTEQRPDAATQPEQSAGAQ